MHSWSSAFFQLLIQVGLTSFQVFGRAKMWEKALRIKADMLETGVIPNVVTWTSIIGACANAGLVEQSFREFDEMLTAGCRPNVNCYNMLLQACIMVMLLACYLLSSLSTLGEASLGSNLDGKDYTTLLIS